MIWLAAAVLLLAFANGANDNFKGVATLLGSRTSSYRGALIFATLTTLAGSILAIFLAAGLISRFQGKGLVPVELTEDPSFLGAVALGAGLTVLLATRLGLPTSTTHALIGALVGAGIGFVGSVRFDALGAAFLLPLLVSPVLALLGTLVLYPLFHRSRVALGVTENTCFCVGQEVVETTPALAPALAVERSRELTVKLGAPVSCQATYGGQLMGVRAAPALDSLHYVSAGAVSFARGLNDTPKIAALLLLVPALGTKSALALVGVAIAVGGVLAARRVAQTMSYDITPMNPGQGFTANLVTAFLVIVASRFGLPVSTTHVSCGSLFGLGIVRRGGSLTSIGPILLAWVFTLPLAGGIAWVTAQV